MPVLLLLLAGAAVLAVIAAQQTGTALGTALGSATPVVPPPPPPPPTAATGSDVPTLCHLMIAMVNIFGCKGAESAVVAFQAATGIPQTGCYDATTQSQATKYVSNAPTATCSC